MTKKKTKTPKLANITEAITQQDQMVAKVYVNEARPFNELTPEAQLNITEGLRIARAAEDAAIRAAPASNTTEPPKRKKGLARCYKLDAATKVTTALLTVQHQRTSILAIKGWNQRLRMTAAAPHAANAFAKDAHSEGLIPAYLYSHALGMTIARCMDYGVTPEEAAELVQKAIEKKVNEFVSPNG